MPGFALRLYVTINSARRAVFPFLHYINGMFTVRSPRLDTPCVASLVRVSNTYLLRILPILSVFLLCALGSRSSATGLGYLQETSLWGSFKFKRFRRRTVAVLGIVCRSQCTVARVSA